MNYNQNEKIAQITSQTLIIGVDIAKYKHVARAQDFRGLEISAPLYFENTNSNFNCFIEWIKTLMGQNKMEKVIVGMEPTGHYWLNLAHFLKDRHIKFVVVNPMHVKKSKELDDNSPTKNDVMDARVIAQLVKDGRYAEPNIPQGVYAELRVARKIRDLLSVNLQAVQGQIHNWIDRYFPEFLTVFKDWEGKSAIQLLKLNLLPHELVNLSEQEILVHLRKAVKRAVGLNKIKELKQVAMPLVAKNKAFKELHEYFTKRPNNPLKKMQSLIAICNKLIRILFTIGKKQCEFSEERMLRDIPHMAELQIAA